MPIDQAHLVVALTTAATVVLCVLFHYEGLTLLGRWITTDLLRPRPRILVLIFGQLMLHITEIWAFALAYFLLLELGHYGALKPIGHLLFEDYVYFSAVVYTTLGLGDLIPSGAIRFLTGTEVLLGFVLITWSASFTFLEMQRYWGRD